MTSTWSRYPPRAVRLDGSSKMTNPIAISRPSPMPRSITTLVKAFRQSQPSRTTSQARTPSPAKLGRTCATNIPIAVAAIMMPGVIRAARAPSASTTFHQRTPASGIWNITISSPSAAQRKSNSRIADKAWLKSIWREMYQKHAPVTTSFAAKMTIFPAAPPRRVCELVASG